MSLKNITATLDFCTMQSICCEAVKHDRLQELGQDLLTVAVQGDRSSILHCAASHGNEQAVSYLLQECPELLDMETRDSRTALHCAAFAGHERVVAQLLSARPTLIDMHTHFSCTALHYAASEGREAAVARLLAQISVIATNHWTALHFAANGGHEQVVKQLLAADPTLSEALTDLSRTALHCAATKGHVGVAAILLAADPRMAMARDYMGQLPIHHAARHGHEAAVRFFLARQPDFRVDMTDKGNDNILHMAVSGSLPIECVAELWRLDPNTLRLTNWGAMTPFDVAVKEDRKDAIELFHGSLTFDEVERSYIKLGKSFFDSAKGWLRPVLERQCEALSLLLLPDVVGIVFEFLGFGKGKVTMHVTPEREREDHAFFLSLLQRTSHSKNNAN